MRMQFDFRTGTVHALIRSLIGYHAFASLSPLSCLTLELTSETSMHAICTRRCRVAVDTALNYLCCDPAAFQSAPMSLILVKLPG